MRNGLAAALAVVTVAALAPAGRAQQSNPSAQQIINSLKPTGNLGTTRGIRLAPAPPAAAPATPATPATAAVPAPAPTPAPAPAVTTAAAAPAAAPPSVNLNVEFATNSANLTPAARQTLDALGKALSSQQLAAYRFRIEGHTDTVGSPAYNLTLSQHRADAVAAYLERKFGIPAAKLQTVGMGEGGLLVPTPPNTPNAKNRRVQVINLGT
ncbi:MAG: OmpA family protein [Rhodospirillales bacterium]|nr:OmpA family protein [Rhodospirillales bacterium]